MSLQNVHWRLTFWYVLIVMIISLTFSAVVYLISFHEITIFNRTQSTILRRTSPRLLSLDFNIDEFESLRQKQVDELKDRMLINLALTNLTILLLAGLASYYFSKKTLQPIEEMLNLQNRFTADASHELRTPLAAIKIETEVALRDKNLNLAESKKLLKSNLEEIEKLEKLSNDLLELAQYDTISPEKFSDNFKSFSIKAVIHESIDNLSAVAQKKQIKIKTKIGREKIKVDHDKILELFNILLDNAIKYSPEKSQIIIESEVKNKIFTIRIKDSGIGIAETDLPFIFDRFFRADQARSKEKYRGYGLGLSIARQIIKAHHGDIIVESNLGHGTTFVIKLPLVIKF